MTHNLAFKKYLLSLFLLLFFFKIDAQTGIFFQAIARDNNTNPARDRKIYVQTNIIQTSPTGTIVLTEEHQTNTDAYGVFNIMVGDGVRIGGALSGLSSIDWSKGPFYLNLKIAITPLGLAGVWDYSKAWVDLGTTIFGTTPSALYANKVAGFDTKLNSLDTAKMLLPYSKVTAITTEASIARAAELVLTNNVAASTASITSNALSISAETIRATAAELVLTNNVAANTASINANTNEIALKANRNNPVFTGTVAIGTSTPTTSAVLDVNSTTKGILIPRITSTERDAIISPDNALLIFNTTNNKFEVFKSTCSCWVGISDGGSGIAVENTAPKADNLNYTGLFKVGGTGKINYNYTDPDNDAEGTTTFIWDIATTSNGSTRTTFSTGASTLTGASVIFQNADAGKYVRARLTPRAATGLLNGIEYYGTWILIEALASPYASNVTTTGIAAQGNLLTGSYTFAGGTGVENTLGSTYTWQSATSNKGVSMATMSFPNGGVAHTNTIVPTISEVNKYVRFGVIAKDNASGTATNNVYSNWIGPVTLAQEAPPYATNITISNAPFTNALINGNYNYLDANNDPEGVTTFKWYKADDATGRNQIEISGQTSKQITLNESYIGSYIGFGVTPIALTGNTTGTAAVYYHPNVTTLSTPLATSLSFAGSQITGFVGTTLTGTYSYSVNNSTGTESGTQQKWYTSTSPTDVGTLVATGASYTTTANDLGKYISYEVTPSTTTGVTGNAFRTSRYTGSQILDFTTQNVKVAYSLRKLKAAYAGNAIQVRRSYDNTTRDIGFTSTGLLDEATLISFVTNSGTLTGTSVNGFVSIWYDQSGNGKNVSNTTLTQQPKIVTNGAIEKWNGVPTVMFVRSSQTKLFTSDVNLFTFTSAMVVFANQSLSTFASTGEGLFTDINSSTGVNYMLGSGSAKTFSGIINNTSVTWYKNKIGYNTTVLVDFDPLRNLSVLYAELTQNNWNGLQLGQNRLSSIAAWDGPISELILFEQSLKANSYADVLKIQDAQILYYLGK